MVGAEIVDYKTDALHPGDAAALAARAQRYGPQLDAYRAAVAAGYGIAPTRIIARLLFLAVGEVVEL